SVCNHADCASCPYPLHLPEKKSEGVNLIQDGTAGIKKPTPWRRLFILLVQEIRLSLVDDDFGAAFTRADHFSAGLGAFIDDFQRIPGNALGIQFRCDFRLKAPRPAEKWS